MRYVVFLAFTLFAQAAAAGTHGGCNAQQFSTIDTALGGAKALTLQAAAAVRNDMTYARWFGDYSVANAEQVRATLKGVMEVIRGGAVTFHCRTKQDANCGAGEYAFVLVLAPYQINICPNYFELPPMQRLDPGRVRSEYGTQEGTIIHEITHFHAAGSTADHCYARTNCANMAQGAPLQAIDSADSYQYFAEDISYRARNVPEGKPGFTKDRGE